MRGNAESTGKRVAVGQGRGARYGDEAWNLRCSWFCWVVGSVDGGFSAGGAVWGGGVGAGGLSVCEDFRAGAVGGGVGFGSWAAVFLEAGSEEVSGRGAVEGEGLADGVVGGIGDGDVGVGGVGAEWAWGTEVGRGAGVGGVVGVYYETLVKGVFLNFVLLLGMIIYP